MKINKQSVFVVLFVFVFQACSQDNSSFESFKNKFDSDFKSELKENQIGRAHV